MKNFLESIENPFKKKPHRDFRYPPDANGLPTPQQQLAEIEIELDVGFLNSSMWSTLLRQPEENPYSFAFKGTFVITSFCFLVYGFRSDYAGHSVETGELKECTEFPLIFKSMFVSSAIGIPTLGVLFVTNYKKSPENVSTGLLGRILLGYYICMGFVTLWAQWDFWNMTDECVSYITNTGSWKLMWSIRLYCYTTLGIAGFYALKRFLRFMRAEAVRAPRERSGLWE